MDTKYIPTPDDIKRVKGLGFLRDKRFPDVFNARVITGNGKITAKKMAYIADAAERFGSGEVAMTTRQTVEIQGIPYSNIQPLIDHLAKEDLSIGGTGPKVRPVVSCKGTTCVFGLIDAYSLSEKIHERFYMGYHDVTLPHKFKIAVGGCPNNCVKPDLNDLGIIGQRVVNVNYDKCRGCKTCQIEKACPIGAAKCENGKITVASDCNRCGRCAAKCTFGAFESYITGYKICIGGRWGKKVAMGRPINKLFTSEEEVLDFIEKTILFFKEEGLPGERFADTVNRIGFENAEARLLAK